MRFPLFLQTRRATATKIGLEFVNFGLREPNSHICDFAIDRMANGSIKSRTFNGSMTLCRDEIGKREGG